MQTAWAEIQRLRQELKDEKQAGAERSEWLLKLVMQAAEDAGEKKKKADEEAHVSIQWEGEEAIMERVAALKERWAAGAKLVGQTWEQGAAARKLQHNAHVKEKVEKLSFP